MNLPSQPCRLAFGSRAYQGACQQGSQASKSRSKIKIVNKSVLFLVILVLGVSACGAPQVTSTPSASVSPSSLPTFIPTPTPTLAPSATSTPILYDGILTTKINVRQEPTASSDSLGQLEAGQTVQITARDSAGNWYLVLYPPAASGVGWVAARYVSIAAGVEIPPQATPTPAGPTGRVIQRLNVRSGPGTSFNALGILEAETMVSLTGKNSTASWLQIEYALGPGGRGWVTSQYIQTETVSVLPVLDDYGVPVTPESPATASTPNALPTPTAGLAPPDGDSAAAPAVNILFSATGTHQFDYSSQLSAPEGDGEDWVEFTPYSSSEANATLEMSLACTGNGSVLVELWQNGVQVANWGTLKCGDSHLIVILSSGIATRLRLAAVTGAGMQWVSYTLSIRNYP